MTDIDVSDLIPSTGVCVYVDLFDEVTATIFHRRRGKIGDAGQHTAQEPPRVRLNEHLKHDCGLTVFQHACKMGLEGIVSKRIGSRYRSGRSWGRRISGCTFWSEYKLVRTDLHSLHTMSAES
jgi:hypothetical protein